jgi:hypothetical protein
MLSLYVTPVYLASIYPLLIFTKKVKPVTLMILYNAFQVFYNTTIWVSLAVTMTSHANDPFFLNIHRNEIIRKATRHHYVTKYIDLADTLFIVLSKNTRQLTFLHVYHHSSILIIWDLLVTNKVNDGTIGVPAMINSFVHTVMYCHYLLQSLGYENKHKHWITRIQLLQFVYCFFHSIAVLCEERVMIKWYAIIQSVYQIQMLMLFGTWYRKTYIKK